MLEQILGLISDCEVLCFCVLVGQARTELSFFFVGATVMGVYVMYLILLSVWSANTVKSYKLLNSYETSDCINLTFDIVITTGWKFVIFHRNQTTRVRRQKNEDFSFQVVKNGYSAQFSD